MSSPLRPLAPVVIVFACLLAFFWWGFHTLIEHRRYPNQDVAAGVSGPSRIVLQASRNGHYYVPGRINGHRVRFLVDTGASSVAIPAHMADKLELERDRRVPVGTAAGTSFGYRTQIERLEVGGIVLHDLQGLIMPSMTVDTVLLGMSFLQHVDFRQENNHFIISWPE